MNTINSLTELKQWYSYPITMKISVLVSLAILFWTYKDIAVLKCPPDKIWLDILLRFLPYICWIPILVSPSHSVRISWAFVMMCGFCLCQMLVLNAIPMGKAIIADGFYMWMFVFVFIGLGMTHKWLIYVFFAIYSILFFFSDAQLCQQLGIPKTFLWGGINFLASSKRHLVTFLILIFSSTIMIMEQENLYKILWQQKQEMENIALHDYLSGLYNRNILSKIITDDKYYDDAYIIYIDIDNFKKFNDEYGHDIGDDVIMRVSENLKQLFNNKNDYIIRQGGDEFLCIVSKETNMKTQLRKLYENINDKQVIIVHLSIGYTRYTKGDSIEQTMIRADNALYHSKENGKNQYTEY